MDNESLYFGTENPSDQRGTYSKARRGQESKETSIIV